MSFRLGDIFGVKTSARLDSTELLKVAEQSYSGAQPSRPGLGREYALAYEWAEAALQQARTEHDPEKETETRIRNLLDRVRTEHDQFWRPGTESPGNLPNEELFISRIGNSTGRELREKEGLEERNLPKQDLYGGYYFQDYNSLCRGEKINTNRSRYIYLNQFFKTPKPFYKDLEELL